MTKCEKIMLQSSASSVHVRQIACKRPNFLMTKRENNKLWKATRNEFPVFDLLIFIDFAYAVRFRFFLPCAHVLQTVAKGENCLVSTLLSTPGKKDFVSANSLFADYFSSSRAHWTPKFGVQSLSVAATLEIVSFCNQFVLQTLIIITRSSYCQLDLTKKILKFVIWNNKS